MKKAMCLIEAMILGLTLALCAAPAVCRWMNEMENPPLAYGTVTAKGYDDGQTKAMIWPFRDLLQPGVSTDGQEHYLIEVTRGNVVNWWEVSREQMDAIRIGDAVCRRSLTN